MSLLTWLGIPLGTNDEESNPIDYMSSNPSSPQHNYNTVRDDSTSTTPGGDVPVVLVSTGCFLKVVTPAFFLLYYNF